jgi:hypothetical protein
MYRVDQGFTIGVPWQFSEQRSVLLIVQSNICRKKMMFSVVRLVQKHTRIHICKTLACPVLCYGSEAWAVRKVMKVELQPAR